MTAQEITDISVKRYSPDYERMWNEFVIASKTGVFFFHRNYMDYHSHRFKDHSLLFFYKNQLLSMLPANSSGDTLYSHQGLTFGGMI